MHELMLILVSLLITISLIFVACKSEPAPALQEAPVPAPTPETPSPEPITVSPEPEELELNLVEMAPSSYQLDVTPVYSGFQGEPAQCYLGSLAMLAKYDDPALDFADVIAYCGVGTCAHVSLAGDLGGFGTGPHSIIDTAANLGYGYIIGIAKNGRANDTPISPLQSTFEEKAERIEYFDTEDDAFNFLRRAIASNYPVIVVLDCHYVRDDLARVSGYWQKIPEVIHFSHHFTVTGYDRDYVYLNDPTGFEKADNLPVTIANFKSAWEVTEELTLSNKGPYWMFFLVKKQDQKSASEILAWNKQMSSQAAAHIRKFAENPRMTDMQRFLIYHFIRARAEYAKFLERNGKTEAAALYEQSSQLWEGLLESGDLSDDLMKIADLEEQAWSLY